MHGSGLRVWVGGGDAASIRAVHDGLGLREGGVGVFQPRQAVDDGHGVLPGGEAVGQQGRGGICLA